MASRLSQSEIQEITRLLEQGIALPEKYRDVLFAGQQLRSEGAAVGSPKPAGLAACPVEPPQLQPDETGSATAFVRFLLHDARIEALIREYEDKVVPKVRNRYNRNELATLATGCVGAVRILVPRILQQPSGISGFLSRWAKRTELPAESAGELFHIIHGRLKRREAEMITKLRAKEVVEETEGAERLIEKYSDIVNIFLDFAERKVSVLDEYGDERMHLLGKEVDDCFAKIAGREGNNEVEVRKDLRKYGDAYSLPKEFKRVRGMLRNKFAKHHAEQKGKKKAIEELASLSGADFETAVGRILLENGWHVGATAATGDQGADIIATKGERKVIIQAKRYTGAVGNKAVQEVVGAIPFYEGTEGCVVTNSTFTPAARALAQKNNIRLIDGSRFQEIAEL
jgi:HJR/Mrr/RecB family endonuclease